ncbi:MAG: hypothetical protein RR274_03245 [Erysipelotrichaceae bacterium]
MSSISVGIILGFFVLAFIFMIYKRLHLNMLNNALKTKNYPEVLRMCESPLTRRLLGKYACELYKLRAYVLIKDNNQVRIQALKMLKENYKAEDHKTFLELYYHIFLARSDFETAKAFLDVINKEDDFVFKKYNQYAYDVLVNRKTDLIDIMDKEIEANLYSGFPLGTVAYLIGYQYLALNDKEKALAYFKECIICFHPNDVYVGLANAQIKKLEDEIIEIQDKEK